MPNLKELQEQLTLRDEHSVNSLDPKQFIYLVEERLMPVLYQSNALCGEAGEFANIVKKMVRDSMLSGEGHEEADIRAKEKGYDGLESMRKDEAGKELGDIVMYAALAAQSLGIDLDEYTRIKFNEVSERLKLNIKL